MESCWCGLPKEHHDGREMDAEGNMHVFGRPVKEIPTPYREYEQQKPTPPSLNLEVELLKEVKKFLSVSIINGSKKLPLVTVSEASRLLRLINDRIDSTLWKKE